MRDAFRTILTVLLLCAGVRESCAFNTETRVGKFFSLAASERSRETLQVLDGQRDAPPREEKSASDRCFGFVDGPNLYSYVRCNPWTMFDPEGLDPAAISAQEYALSKSVDLSFGFKAKLDVDVDGYGGAYHPKGAPGADSLDSATDSSTGKLSENVLVFENGHPYIQTSGRFAGFYIAKTSLQDSDAKITDPNRYVDGSEIPYVVYPSSDMVHKPRQQNKESWDSFQDRLETYGNQYRSGNKMELGDLGVVAYLPSNGASLSWTPVIFADAGPRRGEASQGAAKNLGIKASPKDSPLHKISDRVVYIGFPRSAFTPAWPVSNESINARGSALFAEWGRAGGYNTGQARVMSQYFGQQPRPQFRYLGGIKLQ